MDEGQRARHPGVEEVGEVAGQLPGEEQPLVDQGPGAEADDVEVLGHGEAGGDRPPLGGLADHVELPLEGLRIGSAGASAADEELPDDRLLLGGDPAESVPVDGDVPPAEDLVPPGGRRLLEGPLGLPAGSLVPGQEDHGDAVVPFVGQPEALLAGHGPQELVGQLDQEPGAVPGGRVRAGRGGFVRISRPWSTISWEGRPFRSATKPIPQPSTSQRGS